MINGASPITFKLRLSVEQEEPLTGRQQLHRTKKEKIYSFLLMHVLHLHLLVLNWVKRLLSFLHVQHLAK